MAVLVSIEEFARNIPGGIDGVDIERALETLVNASALIRAEAGKVSGWDGDTEAIPDAVRAVCIGAARRAFLNPEGIRSMSIDGHAASLTTGSPDVYLTKSERRVIRRAAGVSVMSLGMVGTVSNAEIDDGTLSDLGL